MPLPIPSEAERAREVRKTIRDAFAKDVTRLTGLESSFEFAFAKPDRKWRSDIAWPDVRVALEIDGGTWTYGRHNRASSILADMEKGNAYSARQWLVFHTPWEWLKNIKKRAELLEQITSTIKQRAHEYGVSV